MLKILAIILFYFAGILLFIAFLQTVCIESKLQKEERKRRNAEVQKEIEWWGNEVSDEQVLQKVFNQN